jgi:hypothetical protein
MSEERASEARLRLSRDEAIVLFELLSRYTDTGALTIEDQAEQRVLWDLCSMLESQLHEPISPDYDDMLERARAAVRDSTD